MNNKDKENKIEKRPIWKSYLKLMFKAKLPYFLILLCIIFQLLYSKLQFLFPGYSQQILAGDISKPVIYGAIAVIIGRTILDGIIRVTSKITNFKIDKGFRKLVWNKLLHSPISLFDKEKPNELVSRTAADTANISMIFSYIIPSTIGMLYFTYTTIQELFSYNWSLGAIQLAYIPIYLGLTIWYGSWQYKTNKKVQEKLSKLTQFLSELLGNMPLIKAFANEKKEEKRGRDIVDGFYKASLVRSLIDWAEVPVSGVLSLIQSVIVIISGIYLVSRDIITIDIWIAYFLYVDMLYGVLNTFVYMYLDVKRSQGATSRISELLDGEEEEYNGIKVIEKIDENLAFENVSFGYGEKQVLSNISFNVPYGKTTAIVGESGGGKTTILSLIQRFYKPNSGEIKFGNTSINELNLKEWRNVFSYVSQDSPLLSGTIKENIIYGVNREVSEEELIEVSKVANLLEVVDAFPNKFETQVGESGSRLSGGQRQRIAIARALLRDSQVLLLDEPTTNLDNQSEKTIQEAMDNLLKDRTTIVIAHDLSTIKDANQIVVIDSGEVKGIGTHDELLKNNEVYKLLVNGCTQGLIGRNI
ncbi:ABC transporter ATP-binding protein [Clostridium sp. Sa3CUN1]|uniref:ABC transporter ATP-binding protein n=1 Tax=Clostridium gallinarum TaxID=2762246 RepID=A0ABR8Q0B1_9CLOT|nr:ABC transporter ATP-binding protein [Clostridium gallinarum]MBD7913858.1 ABC transporter ATP-binding protein [Clostridium gallinarum]